MADNPFVKPITDVQLVQPSRTTMVVLERVEPGVMPDYCIHGKVTCYRCDEWCWLGSETYEMVSAGKATGVCMECVAALNEEHPLGDPIGHLDDHRE